MKKSTNFVYITLNKPRGYVCALDDNLHPTIMELVKKDIKGLHIVGRLDIDTTGLIVLTNDGNYTHNATHPKKHVAKTYEVTLMKDISPEAISQLEQGVSIDYGKVKTLPAKVKVVADNVIHLTIVEGKFHQVKKMAFAINNEVVKLHRIAFDKWNLEELEIAEGEYKIFDKI